MRDENGERQSFTFDTKALALDKEAELRQRRQRIRSGLELPLGLMLFFDFAAEWMRERKRTHPRSTWAGENSRLKRVWLPMLSSRMVSTIKRADIEQELQRLMREEHISAATRNRHRALLHTMFEEARKKDPPLIGVNPCEGIPVLPENPRRQPTWTPAQRETYLAAMVEQGPMWGALATVLILLGPRISEVIALQPQDILPEKGAIIIRRIRESVSGKLVERTKRKRHDQPVEASVYVLALLPRVKAALDLWLAASPSKRPTDCLFTTDEGPVTYWVVENLHQKTVEELKLPRITLHRFRHMAAGAYRVLGFAKREIQEMLGHKHVRTTEGYFDAEKDIPNLTHVVEKTRRLERIASAAVKRGANDGREAQRAAAVGNGPAV